LGTDNGFQRGTVMATKYKLHWRDGEQRWRKRYKGKDYYFTAPEGKVRSYRRCLNEWLLKKAEVDQERLEDDPNKRAWRSLIERVTERLEGLRQEDTPENRLQWSSWFAQLRTYHTMIELGVPYFMEGEDPNQDPSNLPLVLGGLPEELPDAPWEANEVDPNPDRPMTVEGNVKRFLKRKQQQAERGERSHGRYESLRCCLEDFKRHVGGSKPIASIGGPVLSRYRDKLESRVTKGKLSSYSARDRIQAVKQFIRWAWEQELLDLPRIIESREFSIAVKPNGIEVFTPDELNIVFTASVERTRLYILLCLNCGMTQADIADLRQDEVDWDAGRITRKRSKTGKHDSVPEVTYPLWAETFRLLKLFRSDHPDLTLTNRNGTPLKSEAIVNGRVNKTDNIRNAYNRVVWKLANPPEDEDGNPTREPIKIDKPLKLLRKTAASKLGEHESFGRFAQYFLGHAPGNVADKHYVRPSEDQFNAAVEWLGRQFPVGKP